jgi:hypothetical protein
MGMWKETEKAPFSPAAEAVLNIIEINKQKTVYRFPGEVYEFLGDPPLFEPGDLTNDEPCTLTLDEYHIPSYGPDDYSEDKFKQLSFEKRIFREALSQIQPGKRVVSEGEGQWLHHFSRDGFELGPAETINDTHASDVRVTLTMMLSESLDLLTLQFDTKLKEYPKLDSRIITLEFKKESEKKTINLHGKEVSEDGLECLWVCWPENIAHLILDQESDITPAGRTWVMYTTECGQLFSINRYVNETKFHKGTLIEAKKEGATLCLRCIDQAKKPRQEGPTCPKCGKVGTCSHLGDLSKDPWRYTDSYSFKCDSCGFTDTAEENGGIPGWNDHSTKCPYCGK